PARSAVPTRRSSDLQVKKVGYTLKAPGIGDDTRGLAMLISMLKAMNKAGIQTEKDLLFVGTVGEEGLGDLRGVKYIFNDSGLDRSEEHTSELQSREN